MKKTFLFLSSLLAGVSTTIAQNADTDNYSRFELSYASTKFSYQNLDDDTNGFSAGFLWGDNLSANLPLFVEYGFNLTYVIGKDEASDTYYGTAKETDKFLNVALPLNLAYKIALADNVSLVPFAGLNFKVNLVGKAEMEATGYSNVTLDFFDDEEVENTAKRFQLGANVGLGLNINNVYVGYRFQPDFIEYVDNLKTKTHYISLGLNF